MNTSSSGGGAGGQPATNTCRPESHSSNQQSSRNEPTNQRFSNLIHDSEVFLTKLREFKPQSLGCLEARRKSSSTLIFPSPPQACMGPPKCPRHPHNVKPTPGYWIECHGPGPGAQSAGATGIRSASNYACSQQQQQQQTMMGDIVGSKGASLDDQMGASLAGNVASHSCSGSFEHAGLERESSNKQGPSDVCKPQVSGSGESAEGASRQQRGIGERSFSRHKNDSVDESGDITMQDVSATRGQYHRQQSLDTGYELNLEHSQHQDNVIMTGHEPHPPIGIRSSSGGAGSSPEVSGVAAASAVTAQSPPEGKQSSDVAGPPCSGSELRKRLNKRTMTRDDIDLHKTRRGTPNITITEPSFNQSTTTYHQQHHHHPTRQDSRDGSKPLSRVAPSSSASTASAAPGVGPAAPGRQPIKFRVQRYVSDDNKRKDDESRYSPMESQEGSETTIQIGGQVEPIDTDPSKSQTTILPQSQEQQSSASSISRQHSHRPSVIREDADTDSSTGAIDEQKEFYCGLSTVAFNKKPYQQSGQGQTDLSQFKDSSLELISFEEENYEKHYYGREHWNYFTNDELLGPVMLSLKQEVNNQRDHFHVLLRTVSYTLHGTIPASTICADRYDREAIVRELSEIAKLKPPLMLGQLPSTPDELLKLDHIFIKTELKVGVIYIKSSQAESEEAILGNRGESELFNEFLDLLGDRITLKGFDRYKGGLDTVHNLTGTESVYTMWRGIEIMFHVSTMLPHEENDPQKLQKKRHIGNDIVCVAFIESDDTLFWPGCIKSYFLHTFIAVQTSPKPVKEGERRKYTVSCVCRNEVQYAFRPYLTEQDEFFKSDYFREWLLVKIVNGERASYSAPKFARMQDRTRSQLLEDIITNLANHLVTGQIPKPYRRGSWRPLGHTRASSPLEDSMKDYFEDYDQLAKDFCQAFCGPSRSMLCDVVFRVKDTDGSYKLVHGVRAIMAIRSRTFLEMLYGFVPPGTSSLQNQTSLRAIEIKALSGESSGAAGTSKGGGGDASEHPHLLVKRGSVGTEGGKKMGEKERRQSMLPNLSKSTTSKPNYLTVPSSGSGGGGGASAGSGTGGMIKNAFNRLVSGNWSGWSGNIRSYKGEPMHIKVDQNKTKVDLNSLAICKEIAKIDADKLAQREFEIKEFDYETFQQTIEYIHNGQCKLSYETIPGLICAAEHYDLPDLLHACFHHANTHMRLNAAPKMMNALYQNSCFYMTAMQLLDSIYEFIDPTGVEFLGRSEYLELNESVFTTLLSRKTLQVSELKKFQAMDGWAKHQIANKQKQKVEVKRQQSSEMQQDQIKGEGAGDNTTVTGKDTSEMDVDPQQQQEQQQQQQPQQQQQQQQLQQEQSQQQQLPQQQQQHSIAQNNEEMEHEYRALMIRLNKEVNIKLDKISNEDLVKVVLPTKVFSNDKIFEVMADESRNDY